MHFLKNKSKYFELGCYSTKSHNYAMRPFKIREQASTLYLYNYKVELMYPTIYDAIIYAKNYMFRNSVTMIFMSVDSITPWKFSATIEMACRS